MDSKITKMLSEGLDHSISVEQQEANLLNGGNDTEEFESICV